MGRASEPERETIAHIVAAGDATVHDLAERYGYTLQGMKNLLKTRDMARRIEERRRWIEARRSVAEIQFLTALPELTEEAIALAKNDGHKDQASMLRYCIDKIMPTRQVVETHNEHALTGELAEEVIKALKGANEARGERRPAPTLLEGADALPAHGEFTLIDEETPDAPPGGNGATSDSTDE